MLSVYKKRYPANAVSLSTGKSIKFEDIGGLGFYRTDDPAIIADFEAAMKASRGGIEVSTQAEYDAAVKKKPNSLKSNARWNELQTSGIVVSLPVVHQSQSQAGAVAPATGGDNPIGTVKAPFVPSPTTGKRAK